jgi:hypothetical protein
MPTLLGRNYTLQELETAWGHTYEQRLNLLGSTAVILPMGDPLHYSAVDKFKTVGEEQVEFTWSEAIESFDTPFDRNLASSYQGIIPVVTFNGTDEEADSPDAGYWSRVGTAFSVGAWVNLTDATSSYILSRHQSGDQEWLVGFGGSDQLFVQLVDDSAGSDKSLIATSDSAVAQGQWVYVVATVDGEETTAGLLLYENGVLLAANKDKGGNYSAMEDLVQTTKLGHRNTTPASIFDGIMAGGPLGVTFVQVALSADVIRRDFEIGRRALALN